MFLPNKTSQKTNCPQPYHWSSANPINSTNPLYCHLTVRPVLCKTLLFPGAWPEKITAQTEQLPSIIPMDVEFWSASGSSWSYSQNFFFSYHKKCNKFCIVFHALVPERQRSKSLIQVSTACALSSSSYCKTCCFFKTYNRKISLDSKQPADVPL